MPTANFDRGNGEANLRMLICSLKNIEGKNAIDGGLKLGKIASGGNRRAPSFIGIACILAF